MRILLVLALGLAPLAGHAATADDAARAAIARVLDDWHDAAAHADEARYFGYFAPAAIYLGTDASERWDLAAFRRFAHPYFARGKAWSFRATRRDITLAPGGHIAWMDETLATPNLGPARGSGVLVLDGEGRWRIAQYHLAVTVPNERFAEVKRLLEQAPATAAPVPTTRTPSQSQPR